MTKYLLHFVRRSNWTNYAKVHYDDLAEICSFINSQIYFGFGKAATSWSDDYFSICQEAYNPFEEGGELYVVAYNSNDSEVNEHNINYWIEYVINRRINCDEDADYWARIIASENFNLRTGEVTEVVFSRSSKIKIIEKFNCKDEKQCKFMMNYFADKYGLTDKFGGFISISDFTVQEWKKLWKYLDIDGNGNVKSKSTNKYIEKDKIRYIKEWIKRRE